MFNNYCKCIWGGDIILYVLMMMSVMFVFIVLERLEVIFFVFIEWLEVLGEYVFFLFSFLIYEILCEIWRDWFLD